MAYSEGYRRYMLAVLTAISAFNFVDRFALGMLAQDLKTDLSLTDTQLGLLSGLAFAVFYSLMGVPIARWADRGNRVHIIALTAALWSLFVVLCGKATTFLQLLLLRVVVGIGEAGCMPPANSLIGDYFARRDRPWATAIYMQSVTISTVVAYFAAGWLNQLWGWRATFICIGCPGVVLAVITAFTLKEPRRQSASVAPSDTTGRETNDLEMIPVVSGPDENRPLREVLFVLWANRSFRLVLYAFSVFYFFAYGTSQWQPAFLQRSFGLTTGAMGTWLAVIYGVGGAIGTHFGGAWARRYAPSNESLQLKAMAILNGAFNCVIWMCSYLAHQSNTALAWMALSSIGGASIVGPLYAITQTLAPSHMRAMAIAVVLFFANLIGMGLGPLAVGFLSDVLEPVFGQESLRYALLLFSPGYLLVSWYLWRASLTVERDIQRVQDDRAQEASTGIVGASFKTPPPATE